MFRPGDEVTVNMVTGDRQPWVHDATVIEQIGAGVYRVATQFGIKMVVKEEHLAAKGQAPQS